MKTSRCGVELSDGSLNNQEVFVSHATHAKAALTPRARLRLAVLIVEHGWPVARAAERYDVSWKTAAKWAERYRDEGPAGMVDRSSARHHRAHRTPPSLGRKIVRARLRQRMGPVQIADLIGVPSSVHAVVDDHSRVAYVEAHDDETKETATTVLRHAVAWFADRGVAVRKVLSDNGGAYRSFLWRDTCAELDITPSAALVPGGSCHE